MDGYLNQICKTKFKQIEKVFTGYMMVISTLTEYIKILN